MSPAMERLAEDPNVKAAMIITDGYVDFPRGEMPYQVLWALTPNRDSDFSPGYGVVVAIDPGD
jgi:predicted metal-dependent peptidase